MNNSPRTMDQMVDYLLACLGEECGEIQQEVGKALRFGMSSRDPKGRMTLLNIVQEVHDLMAVYQLLCEYTDIDSAIDHETIKEKRDKVLKYSDTGYYMDFDLTDVFYSRRSDTPGTGKSTGEASLAPGAQ